MSDPYHSACERLIHFYTHLTQESLHAISAIYHPDVCFKDPFNDVRGCDGVTRIFAHMFDTVDNPSFTVTQYMQQFDQAFLIWSFTFQRKGKSHQHLTIKGVSHVRFNETGLVVLHRDYWDPAEELYEKIPLLGGFMRWLKRQLTA